MDFLDNLYKHLVVFEFVSGTRSLVCACVVCSHFDFVLDQPSNGIRASSVGGIYFFSVWL